MAALGAIGTTGAILMYPSVRQFDREGRAVRGRTFSFLKSITEPLDSDFEERPQRLMNGVAILVVVIAWFGVAIRHYETALILLLTALSLGLLGSWLRRRGLLP
jgi:hypothetical protein